MFAEILGKIDGWFGRSFLLARYFPWLLFCLANALIAAIEFEPVRTFLLEEYRNLGSGEKLVNFAIALSAVAVIAFTLSPAVQPITRLLEGKGIPWWMASLLAFGHVLKRDRRIARGNALFQRRAKLPASIDVIRELARDREEGAFTRDVADPGAIDKAETAIRPLRNARYLNRPIEVEPLNTAISALSAALRANCAEVLQLRPAVDVRATAHAEALAALHREMTDQYTGLVTYAADIAQSHEAHEFDSYQTLFARLEVAPTRFGNDLAALRSYCDTRYGFDFDLLWPRLQMVIKNETLLAKLENARIQLDFSILSLSLSGLFTVTWLAVLGIWGSSLAALLIVVVFGPLMVVLWLWIVHESFTAFSETVRGTIDIGRFDLLKALHRPLPKTLGDERAIWAVVAAMLSLDEPEGDIAYEYGP
ncbi:hypothetical protein [Neorhizobium galegae]|uniref:hypothetical protein n=1 Tax=Neorhizobium galegae TaxID=399 RepID=UPI000621BCEA|nr:hypothetical protein [Neorhizobium galegae]CDZ29371.1 Hypothetical protein NGAL_HAMBI490_42370 [Neorhizobium galegae bv. officinalis]KAA9386439.1 hypothetical protein F4V88_08130 [Neorhizobium galegae]KAB1112706.1 hypothetical protein F4V89_14835 [Neorhizobium galegae]MCM2500637.1 hypothetical protein [Neorhizobium galegae]MCQ1764670.1 hypothetical protein [Neorhizobium galegae]